MSFIFLLACVPFVLVVAFGGSIFFVGGCMPLFFLWLACRFFLGYAPCKHVVYFSYLVIYFSCLPK